MAEGGITLAELAKSGRHVIVQCGACPNRRLTGMSVTKQTLHFPRCLSVANALCMLGPKSPSLGPS